MYTPVNPEVGFKGAKIIKVCFRDVLSVSEKVCDL